MTNLKASNARPPQPMDETMTSASASATATTTPKLDPTAIDRFAAKLRGPLLRPGDDGYDGARVIWNAMIDKRPAFIARCAGAADVVQSVNFARDHGLLLSVRGGGHNVAGNAVCDGGLMIDLSLMKGIRVDPQALTARAEAGLTWAEFDAETQAFGLATTGGVVPTTGIAGLTLGGGIGWLMGKHGLAADNLLSVDIVTADGRLLTASATRHEDLFWGLRGGGGNFGVATSFEYRLHAVGELLGGMLVYPLEQARDVLGFYNEFTRDAPDELTTMVVFVTTPDGVKVCGVAVCYNGPLKDGESLLRPLREFGRPLADQIGPISYGQIQNMFTEGFPPGLQNYWKSSFLSGFDDKAIDIVIDHFERVPSPTSAVAIEQLGGAVRRFGDDETAFSHRNARFNLLIVGIWPDPAEKEAHVGWVRDLWDAMQPYSSGGVYVNYLGQEADEGEDRIRAAYGAEKYKRLVALKRKYDPDNLFRLNQNIKPTDT